jgi:hypothetical protein
LLTQPTITANYTVAANFNASSSGTVDVATGITLDVGANANLSIS